MNFSVDTPLYVLKDGPFATFPSLIQVTGEATCTAIYGFSKKSTYDAFMSHSNTALMPYPLVKRFLENQMAAGADMLQLVVVDATSSNEGMLLASTFGSILDALSSGESTVQTTHRLVLDEASNQYRVGAVG